MNFKMIITLARTLEITLNCIVVILYITVFTKYFEFDKLPFPYINIPSNSIWANSIQSL